MTDQAADGGTLAEPQSTKLTYTGWCEGTGTKLRRNATGPRKLCPTELCIYTMLNETCDLIVRLLGPNTDGWTQKNEGEQIMRKAVVAPIEMVFICINHFHVLCTQLHWCSEKNAAMTTATTDDLILCCVSGSHTSLVKDGHEDIIVL
ncbi:hypothetical protein P7K49_022005 [Saguinus oedipus]|uniref:Uncharacterized protein n=1 Tax=Saguinus oedipus TaxID=9490 RepID=A0ABQ9UWN2_SAGOE|nr:hypothetical protein P7K49_022005 [Saguinus oedipus]